MKPRFSVDLNIYFYGGFCMNATLKQKIISEHSLHYFQLVGRNQNEISLQNCTLKY